MQFDYTYIYLFGLKIFEPITILTNFLIGFVCLYCFLQIIKTKTSIAFYWSMFFLLIGISSTIGSIGHGTHHQFGISFFNVVLFLMNAVSLIAIYYCFKAAYSLTTTLKSNNKLNYFVIGWITILLLLSIWLNNFLLIKIHAGIVLTYSLIMHIKSHKKQELGSNWIAIGILVSFLSIVTHSVKLSLNDWFNHKDISHVIMALSLIIIYKGVNLKVVSGNSEHDTNPIVSSVTG